MAEIKNLLLRKLTVKLFAQMFNLLVLVLTINVASLVLVLTVALFENTLMVDFYLFKQITAVCYALVILKRLGIYLFKN